MDIGCYCVDAIRVIFGEEPIAVYGHAEHSRTRAVDMAFAGSLFFSGGRIGLFTSSFRTALDWGVEIVGTQGRIHVPSPWKPDAHLSSFTVETNGKAKKVEVKNGGNIYHLEMENFCRCILNNKPPALPPEEGLKNMRVIEALKKSALQKKEIRLL